MSREAMKHIKTWSERCEEHPDHQQGMISERMIQERMQEEIDELRQALETEQKTAVSPGKGTGFRAMDEGYYCVVCGKYIEAVDDVIVHDDIPHPVDMAFDEEENPQ